MWRQSVFRQHRRYDTPTHERVLCHGLRTGRADVNMYKTWNEDTLSQDATSHTSQASRSLLENRARYIITPRLGGNEGWALTTGRRGVITSLAAAPEQAIKKRGAVAVWQAGIGPCVSRSLLMLANVAHNHTHTHMGQVGGGAQTAWRNAMTHTTSGLQLTMHPLMSRVMSHYETVKWAVLSPQAYSLAIKLQYSF